MLANLSRYKKYFKFVRKKPLLILRIIRLFLINLFLGKNILRKLELSITYDCQCNCDKCSSYKLKLDHLKELSLEEIKDIAEQAYRLGVFQVNLIGGEPLLRDDLLKIIKCFRVKTTFLSLSTNGALLTDGKIKELKKAGIDFIKISLDSPSEKEHDAARKLPGLFSTIINAVEIIRKEGLLCELTTVATKEILRSRKIWDLVQMCEEKKAVLGLTIPAVCGRWSERFDVLLEEEDMRVIDRLVKYPHVIRDVQTGLFNTQCSAGKEQLYITAYGDILPCSVVQISFGNVRKDTLKKIWEKTVSSEIFSRPRNKCLAGEDREFIESYLKPLSKLEKLPCSSDSLNIYE